MTVTALAPPTGLVLAGRSEKIRALRAVLHGRGGQVVPGASDALTARLVERAGFPVCYATGAGLANTSWGLPDIGLTSMKEVIDEVGRLASATSVPVIADLDDGYGGPLNVMRAVAAAEAVGVAGIQIEDQAAPRRCGHFAGKQLVSANDMVAKILAARTAATDETVVVARTDAIAVEGFDAAIERARLYLRAGADALFVEAPETVEQLRAVPRLLRGVPLVTNVVPGGRTPSLPTDDLAELGYTLVLHANLVMRVMVRAAQAALSCLAETGDTPHDEAMITWDERQELVGLPRFTELETSLRSAANNLTTQEG